VRPPRKAPRPAAAAAALLLAALTLLPAVVRADEVATVRVLVNDEPRGVFAIRITPGGNVLVAVAGLEALGIPDLPRGLVREIDRVPYLSLNELFPRVTWRLDRLSGMLFLGVREGPAPEAPFRVPEGAREQVIMAVTVNTVPVGERVFYVNAARRPLLKYDDLAAFGYTGLSRRLTEDIGGTDYVLLDDLAPSLRYTVDEEAARLDVTIAPSRLPPTVVDLGPRHAPGSGRIDAPAAFLNYAAEYQMARGGDFASLSTPLEAGLHVPAGFGYSSFLYTRDDVIGVERFVRQDTHFTHDDEAALRRYRLGDVTATAGALGGSARIGGLSIAKQFDISPYFIRYPGLSLSGTLQTPSEVSVYVNGALVRRDLLPAGDFTYADLPRGTGAGTTELVIRDAFGRETRVEAPFYVSPELLQTGLSAYSYNLGVKRKDYGTESFSYGGPVFAGFHQRGFGSALTVGMRAEADGDVASGGPSARFLLGGLGEMDLAVAASQAGSRGGDAWQAGYGYSGRAGSLRLSAVGRSRDYANLSLGPRDDKPRLELAASAGVSHRTLGSLAVARTEQRPFLAPDLVRTTVFYSHPVQPFGALFLRASRTVQDTTVDEVFAGVTVQLGAERFASADWQRVGDTPRARLAVQKNAPLGPGVGYRLEGVRTEDAAGVAVSTGDAYGEYHGPWGVYHAEARAGPGAETYRVGAAGTLAWTGGLLLPGRPVRDAFAVVRVPDMKGVRVYYANRLEGRTGRGGAVLVPDLLSYQDNRLSIEPADLPVNAQIGTLARTVTVPYRGAGTVGFPVTRTQGITGHLYVPVGGKPMPAELARLTVEVGPTPLPGLVGRGGEFYLEGLSPGVYPGRVDWNGVRCRVTIRVPESDAVVIDLGKVVCEAR
jgi:outer membrane usher protein